VVPRYGGGSGGGVVVEEDSVPIVRRQLRRRGVRAGGSGAGPTHGGTGPVPHK